MILLLEGSMGTVAWLVQELYTIKRAIEECRLRRIARKNLVCNKKLFILCNHNYYKTIKNEQDCSNTNMYLLYTSDECTDNTEHQLLKK